MPKEHVDSSAKSTSRQSVTRNNTLAATVDEDTSAAMIQRVMNSPSRKNLTPQAILALQRKIGNQAVQRLIATNRPAETFIQRCGCGGGSKAEHESEGLIQEPSSEGRISRKTASTVIQRAPGEPCYIPGNANSLYNALGGDNAATVGPGEEFTGPQKTAIYAENSLLANAAPPAAFGAVALQKSDAIAGGRVIREDQATPVHSAIDHIVPAAEGGCNSPKNAQVLSQTQNSSKSGTYPWAGDAFTGHRVYDPTGNQVLAPDVAEQQGLMVMEEDVRRRGVKKGRKKRDDN